MENKKMKIARIERGLTQEDLSYLTMISRKTIGMIESGKMENPSLQVCTAICRALDKDLNDLFWLPKNEFPTGSFVIELKDDYDPNHFREELITEIEKWKIKDDVFSIEILDASDPKYAHGKFVKINMRIMWIVWRIIASIDGWKYKDALEKRGKLAITVGNVFNYYPWLDFLGQDEAKEMAKEFGIEIIIKDDKWF